MLLHFLKTADVLTAQRVSEFTYLICNIYYVSVSVKSWWQWRNVHHTTQHLTFTMPCYSLCTLKICHFHTAHFCHASGHTVTTFVHSHCIARVLCPYASHYHIPWLLCISEYAHLAHNYITYPTSTTTATHIHFTLTNYPCAAVTTHTAVSAMHCYIIIYVSYPWLYSPSSLLPRFSYKSYIETLDHCHSMRHLFGGNFKQNKKSNRWTSINKMAAPITPISANQTSLQHQVKFSTVVSYKGESKDDVHLSCDVMWHVTHLC